MQTCREVDVLVIGAGVSGLLLAAYAASAGRRTLVVERRRIPGGRFSGELVGGAQLSTGGLHLIPHGSRGPLARALRELGVDQAIVDSDVICSVWSPGRHVTWRRPLHVLTRVLPRRELPSAARFFLRLFWDRGSGDSFGDWLRRHRFDGELVRLTRACVDFALSARLEQLAVRDAWRVLRSFMRFGGPGTPLGGSRALADRLLERVQAAGGQVLLHTEVTGVEPHPRGWSVSCRDRERGETCGYLAGVVVGTAGRDAPGPPEGGEPDGGSERASGYKMQLLLPFSLVPHNGVMFCLGTRRISGLAQVSNADPALAPPGRHLVNTFHVCSHQADPREERREVLRDLAAITGREIAEEWVLSAAVYRAGWPVNRRLQGRELATRAAPGFYLAGDACKPAGLIMVEAAAQSARELARELGFA